MPRLRRQRRGQARHVGEFVDALIERQGLNRGTEHRLVFDAWQRILPDHYRTRCRPVSFRRGRLVVAVESSPLLEELAGYRVGELVRLLNEELSRDGHGAHVVVRGLELKRS